MGRIAVGSALILSLGLAMPALGQPAPGQRMDASVIEQIVVAGFKPDRIILLRENGLGEVQQHTGVSIGRPKADPNKPEQLLAGARVPAGSASAGGRVYFSFFLAGSSGNFAATPVSSWSAEQLRQNNESAASLADDLTKMESDFRVKQAELVDIDRELGTLRARASQIAGVDEIIDLKMKLTRAKGFGEDTRAEQNRLRKLVESGRNLPEPDDSKMRVQELSLQLMETARVTAMADRLNSRRRDAAKASLNKKVALVQEMKSVDATALARDVLKLRAERKQLEKELGGTQTPDSEL